MPRWKPILTEKDLRDRLDAFKTHMLKEQTYREPYDRLKPLHGIKYNLQNTKIRLIGADHFVDYLCGAPIKKRRN